MYDNFYHIYFNWNIYLNKFFYHIYVIKNFIEIILPMQRIIAKYNPIYI